MSTFLTLIKSFLLLLIMLFRYVFYRAVSSVLTGLVLFFVAVLMFVTFYQAYMPVVSHVKPVHLQFSSDCQDRSTALCSYPEATVFFTSSNKANDERMLMRGQSYKVFLDIEMPSSPTNEKLGMFMVNVKFLTSKGTVLKSSSRSCMLHFESSLVRLFRTVFYSLPLTLGLTEEKQKVEINFFEDYIDDSYQPAVQAKVVIMSKQVEIYSSTLRLQASFTGLRYVIFNWPVLFACLAIMGNFCTVTLIYSACINQFSSSPATSNSDQCQTQQQNRNISAHQNGTLPNSTPTRSTATCTANAMTTTTATSAVQAITLPFPRVTTCSSGRTRNPIVNGMPSVRLKISRRQLKIKKSGSGKRRNVDIQSPANFKDKGGSSSSSQQDLHKLHEELNCNLQNTSALDTPLSSNQSTGTKQTSLVDDLTLQETTKQKRIKRIKLSEIQGKERTLKKPLSSASCEKDKAKKNAAMDTVRPTEVSTPVQSMWNNFCFAKRWEIFKLPRIRRLELYLRQNMPSFTMNVRHCTSDLELSTVEENRFSKTNVSQRSASVNDLTILSKGV